MREAATAIKGVLDLYKLNTQAQVNEESQKVMAALEKARKATDGAYDKLCDAIGGGGNDDPDNGME